MQRIVFITIIGVVALLVSGCGAMSGGSMAGMDHGNMDHSGMMTMTQAMTQTTMMTGTQMMTDTMMMSNTQMMPGTQMDGMDHSRMSVIPDQPFDAQFIDGMLDHHRGGVAMAEQALEQAEHPELRTLAKAIIAAQTAEIEEMTAWRQNWYPDLAPTNGLAMNMGEMTISSDASKPFDQRFIEAMISHHQGAIEMAKLAQEMAEHTEIKTLADAIITAQQGEIEQMTGWLKEWFGIGAAFAGHALDEATLAAQITNLADLYGQLRMTHLRAHLQVTPLLTAEQISAYDQLRGYTGGEASATHEMQH